MNFFKFRYSPFRTNTEITIQKLKLLLKILSTLIKEESYFKLLFLNWRIGTELEKAKNILAGNIKIDAKNDHDYIIYIFRMLIKHLKEGDEFIGLCDMNFWSRMELGSGYYLSENIEAVRRGVSIKRLIVVNQSTLFADSNNEDKKRLIEIVKNLYNWASVNSVEFEKMDFHFFINDDSFGGDDYPKSFAFLNHQSGKDYMSIIPDMDTSDNNSFVYIDFKSLDVEKTLIERKSKFEELSKLKHKKKTLEDMLILLTIDLEYIEG